MLIPNLHWYKTAPRSHMKILCENRMQNSELFKAGYNNMISPLPPTPPNIGIILLGGVLCWYVLTRRL